MSKDLTQVSYLERVGLIHHLCNFHVSRFVTLLLNVLFVQIFLSFVRAVIDLIEGGGNTRGEACLAGSNEVLHSH